HTDLFSINLNRPRIVRPRGSNVAPSPKLLEVGFEVRAQVRRLDADDVVFLVGPRVIREIGRSRPERAERAFAVAADVLVVHELGQLRIAAGDGLNEDAASQAGNKLCRTGRCGVGAGLVEGHGGFAGVVGD